MRQLKTFMRNRKAEMLWCGPCECRTLQCWRYANENCGCGEKSEASIDDIIQALVDNLRSLDAFSLLDEIAQEQLAAGFEEQLNASKESEVFQEQLKICYSVLKTWNTFGNYARKGWLTPDTSGPCDENLFSTVVSDIPAWFLAAMWLVECQYLWVDDNEFINDSEIAAYFNSIWIIL